VVGIPFSQLRSLRIRLRRIIHKEQEQMAGKRYLPRCSSIATACAFT